MSGSRRSSSAAMRSFSASLRFFMRWMRMVSHGARSGHRIDGKIKIAVLLPEFRQLAPDFLFFFFRQATAL